MKKNSESKEVKRRNLHGCLPLFLLLSVVLTGVGLWFLPVKMQERVRPLGEGKVYYHNRGLVNYEAARKSPLTLRTDADPGEFFYKDSEQLYECVGRRPELRNAPPMDILPPVADSVVITREILLELPPEQRIAPGEELSAEEAAAQPEHKEVAL